MTLWNELRERLATEAEKGPAWQPPRWEDFSRCKVLAFDPSLSSTGWVHIRITGWGSRHRAVLLNKGTLRPVTLETGYQATWEKASRLLGMLHDLLLAEQHYRHPSAVAWEAPAVAGHRLESSLMAGFCVYEASGRAGTAINANHASSLLTGSPAHDKHQISEAVARYLPGCQERTWNQHQRDALAIALAYSLDLDGDAGVDDDEDIY